MTRELTSAMSLLWKKADTLQVGRLYSAATRSADPTVRQQFKADRDVVGTKAWAICCCMSLANADYTDEECEQISEALDR